ncbi:MAG: hypothetical protein ABI868_22545 [Acidobacteriota bacterium]
MRRIYCLAATTMIALWAVGPTLIAQKQRQIFVSLTGANGTPVTDLQASEVSVTEDGAEGKVVKVEPVNWPTKIQVLVDNGRANTNPINGLRDGLKGLFEQIPAGVEMSMYAIAGTPRPIVKPTTDKQKLLDGIGLIAPDNGAGMFFDALSEAAGRIAREKTPHFPIIVMVGSDFGTVRASDPDFKKLQETILTRAVTVHVILMAGSGGTSGGGAQTDIGLAVTRISGGRFENINANTRLATLLPEWGKKIAESEARQSHQFRVTYDRPANAKEQASIGATVRHDGTAMISLDGHLP